MSFNRFISAFLFYKTGVKHWWSESHRAGEYDISVTIKDPDGGRTTRWVCRVMLNTSMPAKAQHEVLNRYCWSLNIRS